MERSVLLLLQFGACGPDFVTFLLHFESRKQQFPASASSLNVIFLVKRKPFLCVLLLHNCIFFVSGVKSACTHFRNCSLTFKVTETF